MIITESLNLYGFTTLAADDGVVADNAIANGEVGLIKNAAASGHGAVLLKRADGIRHAPITNGQTGKGNVAAEYFKYASAAVAADGQHARTGPGDAQTFRDKQFAIR